MEIIQLTQGKEALIDNHDFDWVNQSLWFAVLSRNNFYAIRHSKRENGKRTLIAMHDAIAQKMGLIGSIDHRDQNSLNNQRNNLRVATYSQNQANTGVRVNNTSGFKGVSWHKQTQKWAAYIKFQRHSTHLGRFDSAIEAAQAYDRAAIRLFGKFASLNSPYETEEGK